MATSFENVNNSLGINATGLTFGTGWADYNGDDLPDLWAHNHFRDNSILYLNQGNNFANVTNQVFSNPGSLKDDNHGVAWGDFDNDGDPDLVQLVSGENAGTALVPESEPNLVYVNDNGVLTDKAQELGLTYDSATSQSGLWVDYNNDGLLDLVHISGGRVDGLFPSTVFRQNSNGTFDDVGETVAPQLRSSAQRLGNLADINGDGNLDLLVEGTRFILDMTTEPFTNITNSVGGGISGTDAITADFNGDLLSDVYLTRRNRAAQLGQKNPNNVRGFFLTNNSEEGARFTASGELDFTTTYLSANKIFIGGSGFNPSGNSFSLSPDDPNVQGLAPRTEAGAYIGYDPNSQTWTAVNFSPNNGRFALDVNSDNPITGVNAIGFNGNPNPPGDTLLINSDQGLVDRSIASGIRDFKIAGNSVTAGDFDNDMDVDIYSVATGSVLNKENVFLDNQGDGTFVSVPNAGGAAGSSLGLGDTVTMADYDLDGFLDLFVTNGYVEGTPLFSEEGPYELFRNQGNSNNWLQIDLEGVESNRDGIGAQVFVTAGGKTQLREQTGGFHKWSQDHQRIHFGLAQNTEVDLLEIRWPSGTVQQLENIPANQLIKVTEEGGTPPPTSNTPPQAVDDTATTLQNETVNINVLANDSDADGDNLSPSIATTPSNGTVAVNNSAIAYTPNNNFIGSDQFTYTIDDGNGGTDTAAVSVTVNSNSTSEAINGTNRRDNLTGTPGDDLINGLGNNDILRGFAGNDTLNGNEGNDNLQGGFNRDVLNGDLGNDLFIAGFGNDTITGGEGADRYRFFRTRDGRDEITDFAPDEDILQFKGNNFADDLDNGVLESDRFVLGTTALDSDDRFIYNQNNGSLFFDVDGVGGQNQVAMATLSNQANLSASDIVIF